MAKKVFFSVLSIILIGAIVFLCCFFFVPSFNEKVKNAFSPNTEEKNEALNFDIDVFDMQDNGIKLASAKLPRKAYSANGLSSSTQLAYTVNATLYPANAQNQEVDWALTWEDDGTVVTDCVILNIPTDGGLTVNLIVSEAFPNRVIKLTCTSRDSGASGYIRIRCEGIATDLSINGSTTIDGCRWGNTNTYAIELTNDLNYVGEAQYSNLKVESVTVHGTIEFYGKYFVDFSNGSTPDCNASYTESYQAFELSEKYPDCVQASINNGNLVVTLISYPSHTYQKSSGGVVVNGVYGIEFTNLYKSPKDAYADVVISCGGLRKTIRVNFLAGVESINLGSDIVF